jgi:RimJ/RimL family protein N-acetyltransferase
MMPIIVGSLLIGADPLVGEFVRARIPHMRGLSWGEHTTLGVVRNGKLCGGVVYYGYRGFDIQIAAAFDRGNWALPGTLRALCAYPFIDLGCQRVTAVTAKKNKIARRALVKAGFQFEGVIRRGLDGVADGFVYGLLKSECKWLKDKSNGNIGTKSTATA